MAEQTIPLGDLTVLEIETVSGSLHLTGWNRDEIRIRDGAGDSYQSKQKGTRLQVSSTNDLIIHLPHNLPVQVKSVHGDTTLRGIASDLDLASVSGDLSLRDVGSITIKTLQGELLASRIQGVLRGDSIAGDCLVEDVQGQVELKSVAGDIQLEKVDGGIDIQASGDGLIDFHPVPWQAYSFQVKGDLAVTMPYDSDADLTIESGGEDINLFPGKLDLKLKQKKYEHHLGEGGTPIKLIAGSKVFVSDDEFSVFTGLKMNLEDLGAMTADFSLETAEQIRVNLGNLEEDLKESLSGLAESLEEIGLSEESLRELGQQIEETSRTAAEKAETAAIKAQAKVEKKIAKARRKALKAREKTKQFDLNEFLENKAKKDSVTEKERMLILKMLQEKKISAEEADNLLKALEGK
jgi:DUF4097 and DUF4098 domain-containing protein YvlB